MDEERRGRHKLTIFLLALLCISMILGHNWIRSHVFEQGIGADEHSWRWRLLLGVCVIGAVVYILQLRGDTAARRDNPAMDPDEAEDAIQSLHGNAAKRDDLG